MKTILIPTDFSNASQNAIRYIANFFQDIKVPYKLILLHSYQVPFIDDSLKMIAANDLAKKNVKEGLAKEKEWIADNFNNSSFEVETTSLMGSLENIIPQVVKEKNVDLVVMGKNGGEHVEQIYKILKHNKSLGPLLVVFG